MDVKEAVRTAKEYLSDLYEGEQIMNVGLEEIVFEDRLNSWRVTIGFSRPWDRKTVLANALGGGDTARSYKVLCINVENGEVNSLTDRLLKASE